MLDTPDASPTWCAGTHEVEADDAGPFDMPIPTAMRISGTTNAAYRHSEADSPPHATPAPAAGGHGGPTDGGPRPSESDSPTHAKPAAVIAKPSPTTWRPPSLAASFGTIGAITTRPTVAGRGATPAR